jgi:hypothetical protein
MKKLKTTACALLLSVSLTAGASAAGNTATTNNTPADGRTNTTVNTYDRTYGVRDGAGISGQLNWNGDRTGNRFGTMNTYNGNTTRANNYRTNAADNDMDWGWLGLLGLIGLAGLRGRNREESR